MKNNTTHFTAPQPNHSQLNMMASEKLTTHEQAQATNNLTASLKVKNCSKVKVKAKIKGKAKSKDISHLAST